jgi:bifunctional UDP-N-acetylglucosamine pyrophosphorylase / glucosamine-1-phosphate N-acetyltransferase
MKTRVVVLAAGHGKRMSHHAPKVLRELKGKPIIEHLLDAILESGVDPRPVIVVGPNNQEETKKTLGNGYEYVVQREQLGTGDATKSAQKALEKNTDTVIVLYGDHPFVGSSTIKKLQEIHKRDGCAVTMMTATIPDFEDWRKNFNDFGRVIRDSGGKVAKIVEKKDASKKELEVKEINPGMYCFNTNWLRENIKKLNNNNAQGEYYLTDLVRIAIDGGECISSVDVSPLESIGVNTPEHLELAENLPQF